jgi:hypothetical protein
MIICLGPVSSGFVAELILRNCLFLLNISFLSEHDHREEDAGVDRHEDPDSHQHRRHTPGPLGVRVSLSIWATLK